MSENALFPDGCALIVGASGGIGAAIARVLHTDGCRVALTWHSREERVATLASELGEGVSTHRLDAREPDQVAAAIAAAGAAHGRVHGLVWAAGPLVEQHLIADTPVEQWVQAFAIETRGFLNATTAVIGHMREHGGGAIVHLGSAGHARWPDRDGLSVVPKAANESLVRGIAREEGRHGIRANSILVGVIDAGMFHELMEQGAFPDGWTEETLKALAIKRWGKPEEIGYAASWLVSKRSAYVTGQQINVSGGFGV